MYGHGDISNEPTISMPNSFIITSTNSMALYILHFHSCNFNPIIVNPAAIPLQAMVVTNPPRKIGIDMVKKTAAFV